MSICSYCRHEFTTCDDLVKQLFVVDAVLVQVTSVDVPVNTDSSLLPNAQSDVISWYHTLQARLSETASTLESFVKDTKVIANDLLFHFFCSCQTARMFIIVPDVVVYCCHFLAAFAIAVMLLKIGLT